MEIIQDVKTYHDANWDSDHYSIKKYLKAKMKLKNTEIIRRESYIDIENLNIKHITFF